MKHVTILLLITLLCGLFTGCITPNQERKEDPPPPELVVYKEQVMDREEAKNDKRYYFRKEALRIKIDISFDIQLRRHVIDLHHFETQGLKWGEKIVWECDQDIPFTVHFGWDSPFERSVYPAHKKLNGKGYETDEAKVRMWIPVDAYSQSFKYFIAAYIKKDQFAENLVVTLDPFFRFMPPDLDY